VRFALDYALDPHARARISARAEEARTRDTAFAAWARGRGPIRHDDFTQVRILDLATALADAGRIPDRASVYAYLAAADRLACAGMWLVAHMTYANEVRLDGRALAAQEFKPKPEGHTGGSLNMVPAYVGYLAANALTGTTRSWLMGQGHCVAAIDAVNVLAGNTGPEHAARYDLSDEGLSRLARDFYSYAIRPDGAPASPLGSHVNAHTGGGLVEGGYLGFAELLYVHMPLPGESLVAFLSDGAFEEQRGSDWAPRWWRAEDSGFALPIMILNGRRIEQRTTLAQGGGRDWLREHLRLNGFDPIEIDGRDPAAYAWAVLEMESRLAACAQAVRSGATAYPVPLHYAVAETVKGFGFPGAGTNRAHNLPLAGIPAVDEAAREAFNAGARALWVSREDLERAVRTLATHDAQGRPRERDHVLAHRDVALPSFPALAWRTPEAGGASSPMEALDGWFVELVAANPMLRPRVGNPDELASNRMTQTLVRLNHRAHVPEPGVAEAVDGRVITALNEEAVVAAALGNQGGLNLVVSYEAFAVKMLGALRQGLIFARHLKEAGRPARWLSLPVVVTSHTWENGKNEQSHQDPTLAEALLGEMSDTARVVFPADANSAVAALHACYATHGAIFCLVTPKLPVDDVFDGAAAERLAREGGALVSGDPGPARVVLAAAGAYQLREARRAARRLEECGVANAVVYLLEPARFRAPRDPLEARFVAPDGALAWLFPQGRPRVFLTHTRPEPFLGALRRLDTGPAGTSALGFLNRGGTLDLEGMLFANRCTWAHALEAAAGVCRIAPETLLDARERAAIAGTGDPSVIFPSLHGVTA
jgi:phosphoketolase